MAVGKKRRVSSSITETAYSLGSSFEKFRNPVKSIFILTLKKFLFDDALTIQKYFEHYNSPFLSRLLATLH